MKNLSKSTPKPRILTNLNGNKIQRASPQGVGKSIGGHIYVHRNYLHLFAKPEELEKAHEAIGPFKYNCARYTLNYGIRFDLAPHFDTMREPGPVLSVQWTPKGDLLSRRVNAIWHHKWLWVKDDYEGFDVVDSFQWSVLWANTISDPSRIGRRDLWNEALRKANLPIEEIPEGTIL